MCRSPPEGLVNYTYFVAYHPVALAGAHWGPKYYLTLRWQRNDGVSCKTRVATANELYSKEMLQGCSNVSKGRPGAPAMLWYYQRNQIINRVVSFRLACSAKLQTRNIDRSDGC